MLARARETHNLLRRRGARRAFATATASSSSRTADVDPEIPSLPAADNSRRNAHRAIMIRPWDGVASMPEALAMIRAIERRFGRIRDFSLVRDPDLPQIYTPFFWAAFRDAESYDRIPKTPIVIKVEVPVVDRVRPGGVGLEDLEGLITSQRYTGDIQGDVEWLVRGRAPTESEDASTTRVMDVRIEHSNKPYVLLPQDGVSMRKGRTAFRAGFYAWGGFAPVTPGRDAPWMRDVREKWEMFLERRRGLLPEAPLPATTDIAHVEDEGEGDRSRDAWAQMESGAVRVPGEAEADAHASVDASPVLESAATLQPEPTTFALPASEPTPAPVSASTVHPRKAQPEAPRLSKRARILAQARENARTPLPDAMKRTAEERDAERQREREEAERVRLSMRDRLFKLMGGKWF